MKKNNLLAILICLACVSCSTLGRYQKVSEVSDSLFGDVAASSSDSSMASLDWKDVFTDPCLQTLIDSAISRNINLNIAAEHVQQAEAKLKNAALSYYPTLNVSGVSMLQGNAGTPAQNNFNVSFTSDWNLGVFRNINNHKSAKASAEQMEDFRQAVQSSLICDVATCYYTLLMLDSQIATAADMQKSWEESVKTVEALMDAGAADRIAVDQYTANLENIKTSLTDLQSKVKQTENALNLLIANEPGTKIDRGTLESQTVPQNISAGLPVLLLTNRPDVRAAERNLELAHYLRRGAVLDFFPALTIKGELGLFSGLAFWVQSLLTEPILNSGNRVAALRIAKSRQREAGLEFQRTLLQAGTEVNDAFILLNTCTDKELFYTARVNALDRAREDTEYLMKNSMDKTYLDVLYANTNFFDAKLALIANKAAKLQAVSKIYCSVGGGSTQ